jgi:hypothetical protein
VEVSALVGAFGDGVRDAASAQIGVDLVGTVALSPVKPADRPAPAESDGSSRSGRLAERLRLAGTREECVSGRFGRARLRSDRAAPLTLSD